MALSVFDMFSVGIGPSSSHTVGPMRAARRFLDELHAEGTFDRVTRIKVELFGSLGATGRGHGSDRAVVLGLEGEHPETVDTDGIDARMTQVETTGTLRLDGRHEVSFARQHGLVFHRRKSLPGHPNGMRFQAEAAGGSPLLERVYYSVGGGFVVDEASVGAERIVEDDTALPLPFQSGVALLERCREHGLSISALLRNRSAWRAPEGAGGSRRSGRSCTPPSRVAAGEGCCRGDSRSADAPPPSTDGFARRRAAPTHGLPRLGEPVGHRGQRGERRRRSRRDGPHQRGRRIIPAVLKYYVRFHAPESATTSSDSCSPRVPSASSTRPARLYLGCRVGCQGEVGVAVPWPPPGSPRCLEDTGAGGGRREIAMEHNLRLTCDPVGGLVQVPCIERNAMGAEGDQRRTPRAQGTARQGVARQGHRDHAPDRQGHEDEVQGDRAGWSRREHHRVLTARTPASAGARAPHDPRRHRSDQPPRHQASRPRQVQTAGAHSEPGCCEQGPTRQARQSQGPHRWGPATAAPGDARGAPTGRMAPARAPLDHTDLKVSVDHDHVNTAAPEPWRRRAPQSTTGLRRAPSDRAGPGHRPRRPPWSRRARIPPEMDRGPLPLAGPPRAGRDPHRVIVPTTASTRRSTSGPSPSATAALFGQPRLHGLVHAARDVASVVPR